MSNSIFELKQNEVVSVSGGLVGAVLGWVAALSAVSVGTLLYVDEDKLKEFLGEGVFNAMKLKETKDILVNAKNSSQKFLCRHLWKCGDQDSNSHG